MSDSFQVRRVSAHLPLHLDGIPAEPNHREDNRDQQPEGDDTVEGSDQNVLFHGVLSARVTLSPVKIRNPKRSIRNEHSLLHLPNFPRPRIGSAERIPIPVESIAFGQHPGPYGMDEWIEIYRHEIVFLDQDPLDGFYQVIPFVQVHTGLMLGP